MTKFTDLEKKVYNASIDDCKSEACIDAKELAEKTGLKLNTLKGVLGSLAKKEKIQEDEGFLYPLIKDHDGWFKKLSYGLDDYDESFIDSQKI